MRDHRRVRETKGCLPPTGALPRAWGFPAGSTPAPPGFPEVTGAGWRYHAILGLGRSRAVLTTSGVVFGHVFASKGCRHPLKLGPRSLELRSLFGVHARAYLRPGAACRLLQLLATNGRKARALRPHSDADRNPLPCSTRNASPRREKRHVPVSRGFALRTAWVPATGSSLR